MSLGFSWSVAEIVQSFLYIATYQADRHHVAVQSKQGKDGLLHMTAAQLTNGSARTKTVPVWIHFTACLDCLAHSNARRVTPQTARQDALEPHYSDCPWSAKQVYHISALANQYDWEIEDSKNKDYTSVKRLAACLYFLACRDASPAAAFSFPATTGSFCRHCRSLCIGIVSTHQTQTLRSHNWILVQT